LLSHPSPLVSAIAQCSFALASRVHSTLLPFVTASRNLRLCRNRTADSHPRRIVSHAQRSYETFGKSGTLR
jgi:hypothetical protein